LILPPFLVLHKVCYVKLIWYYLTMIDIVPTGQNSLQEGSEGKLSLVNLETLWLANKTRENTLKTYKAAFNEFCELNRIQDSEQFRAAGMADIIYYRQYLSKERGLKPRTIRNRLSALSDCFVSKPTARSRLIR